jgi:carbohydrate kinase (thermoresistant glucokinase family)
MLSPVDCRLHALLLLRRSQKAVMACSALKPAYRQLLRSAAADGSEQQQDQQQRIAFILLNPPRAQLSARLQARAADGAHFMPASLLESQLQQLEVPDPSRELYMCFGSVGSNHAEAEEDFCMPSPQQIVDAILAARR